MGDKWSVECWSLTWKFRDLWWGQPRPAGAWPCTIQKIRMLILSVRAAVQSGWVRGKEQALSFSHISGRAWTRKATGEARESVLQQLNSFVLENETAKRGGEALLL